MKRIIATVLFAVFAVPALAAEGSEQTVIGASNGVTGTWAYDHRFTAPPQ